MIKGKFNHVSSFHSSAAYDSYITDNMTLYVMGYIYNLPDKNISIAEQVTHLYQRKGYSAFSELDGGFLILVLTPDYTIIARDHHGIGLQLYYTGDYFCSSLFELKQTIGVNFKPNYNSLATFLTSGHVRTPNSSFENVNKLSAGHVLVYKDKQIETIDLYPYSFSPVTAEYSLAEYGDMFYNLHKEAVRKRTQNMGKVGIILSGGYDSGANLIALREMYSGDIDSYSIGFKDSLISELPQARLMAETFETNHSEYEIDGSEIKYIPQLIRDFGDPFAECGMMVNHCVMLLAGKNYQGVLLGGEGNDHYFASANRQIAMHYIASKYGLKPLLNILKCILDRDMFDKDNILYRTNFHLQTTVNILQGEIFGFPRYKVASLLKDASHFQAQTLIKPDSENYESLYMQHVYQADILKSLNHIIIFKSSKIAEMTGNHISYPFIDNEIYDFMNKLPIEYKCKADSIMSIAKGRGVIKYLHKYIYAPKMPDQIATKQKQGGFVPMSIFFKDNRQRRMLSDFILSSSVCDEFLNRKEVEKFLTRFDKESREDVNWFWYRQIKCNGFFNLLSLAIWWEEFIKNRRIQL